MKLISFFSFILKKKYYGNIQFFFGENPGITQNFVAHVL